MDEAPNQSLKNRNIQFMFENTRVQQQISNKVSRKDRRKRAYYKRTKILPIKQAMEETDWPSN